MNTSNNDKHEFTNNAQSQIPTDGSRQANGGLDTHDNVVQDGIAEPKPSLFSALFTTKRMARMAAIAALYTVLTLLLMPISFSPSLQFRVSEVLTILPLFFPEAIIGLTIGCLISNIVGGTPLDILLGTCATLIAALMTFCIGRTKLGQVPKILLGIIPPIVINALVVPFAYIPLLELKEIYFVNVCYIALGQTTVLCVLGIPLYFTIDRLRKRLTALQ